MQKQRHLSYLFNLFSILLLIVSCTDNFKLTGTVTDVEGNVYKTQIYGTQTWMVEDLRTTKYRNGDPIATSTPYDKDLNSELTPNYQWIYRTINSQGKYDEHPGYGRFYTWYAVTDARNIAPKGWHVSTQGDWEIFFKHVAAQGGNYDGTYVANSYGTNCAQSLAIATSDWPKSKNKGSCGYDLTKNNTTGFSAYPMGYHTDQSPNYACWWTSTSSSSQMYSILVRLSYSSPIVGAMEGYKMEGYAVRCVKDK